MAEAGNITGTEGAICSPRMWLLFNNTLIVVQKCVDICKFVWYNYSVIIKNGVNSKMGAKRTDIIGTEFQSNLYGKVVVVGYEGNKKVTIKFIDYGDEVGVVQLDALRKGLVTPPSATVKTLERWKEVAGINHNNRYDYSHLTTKPKHTEKVVVHCLYCNNYVEVGAEDHLFGKGHCSCRRTEEIDIFYSNLQREVMYPIRRDSVLNTTKDQSVAAACKHHGDFRATVKHLLGKGGCPVCESIKLRTDLIEEKKGILTGIEVLGFTEDLRYILLDTHSGEIKIYDISSLRAKRNSPFVFRVPDQRVTFDVFLQRARAVHGDAYEYSNYKSINEKLTITHKTCGNTFEQLASGHISGNYGKGVGCPHCAKYGLSLSRPTNLYVLIADNGYVKIGITHQQVEGRIRQIHKSSRPVCLFKCFNSWSMLGADAIGVERELLSILKERYEQPPEVFDGSTETFVGASAQDIANLVIKILERKSVTLLK